MRSSALLPHRALTLFLALALALVSAPAHAQNAPNSAAPDGQGTTISSGETAGSNAGGPKSTGAAEDSEASETNAYRHSSAVRYVARVLHMPLEATAKTFEYLNFAILAVSILYFLFKLVPKIFRSRRDALAKQLVDARSATQQANERLGGVEARLARLDDEIASIRKQVEQDAVQDEIRIKAALEDDKKRIAEAAGQEVEAAGAAAQRELRRFAAEIAVEHATRNLSLTAEIDRRLVSDFAREIVGDASGVDAFRGGRN